MQAVLYWSISVILTIVGTASRCSLRQTAIEVSILDRYDVPGGKDGNVECYNYRPQSKKKKKKAKNPEQREPNFSNSNKRYNNRYEKWHVKRIERLKINKTVGNQNENVTRRDATPSYDAMLGNVITPKNRRAEKTPTGQPGSGSPVYFQIIVYLSQRKKGLFRKTGGTEFSEEIRWTGEKYQIVKCSVLPLFFEFWMTTCFLLQAPKQSG